MPNLPETRVKRSRTFENIGVDYLGPISVRSNTSTTKRWIALFTCFTTRAVHLKIAEDISAETFMHIVRRFISRRGYPHQIISDNALQFQTVFSNNSGICKGQRIFSKESNSLKEQYASISMEWRII
ncbi:hypothetical protein QQG55_37915 [Brugia pahangi]